jgi:hypothetical protein
VLRGARQVGKTWLVRDFAQRQGRKLIEINFERDPQARACFDSNDPQKVMDEISLALNHPVSPENTVLFLDEIQAYGEVLAKLRWFAEEMPRLPVVAAGSLLEFTLADHTFSMPVGRISFLHLEPMGFSEYLDAHGQTVLSERLAQWRPGEELSTVLHQQASEWFQRYAMVGGMPSVVAADVAGLGAAACRERQLDLLATYRADFHKYAGRVDPRVLDAVLMAVARSLGGKFIYAHVDESVKQHHVKRALELLTLARVCHLVRHSSANGLPLGGEIKDSFRKVILNDVGLLHALLNSPAQSAFPRWENIAPQVRGQITEQLVGQQLRLLGPFNGDGPQLYYWQREGGRPGEIDYLIQLNDGIVPVELKSGVAGSMKSLHQFMFDKKLGYAVRFDRNPAAEFEVSVKTTGGDPVRYRLCSLPVYFAGLPGTILRAGSLQS